MKTEERINAGWKKLQDDSIASAGIAFDAAIQKIDSTFGPGYAQEHPELIGAFMQSAVTEYGSNAIGKCIQQLAEEVEKLSEK